MPRLLDTHGGTVKPSHFYPSSPNLDGTHTVHRGNVDPASQAYFAHLAGQQAANNAQFAGYANGTRHPVKDSNGNITAWQDNSPSKPHVGSLHPWRDAQRALKSARGAGGHSHVGVVGGGSVGGGGSGGGGGGISAPKVGAAPKPVAAVKPLDPNIAINKQVADYVAASLQAQRRGQDFYQQQTGDQQAATTANASALATAAGSLSSTNPALYSASNNPLTAQMSNGYTDLINHVSGSGAAANAAANQAHIADSGNALQKLFAGNRNAVSMQGVEYGRQLQASVPALRAKAISDQQAAALKAASAQYLQDKLGVTSQNNLANQALGAAKLNQSAISAQTKAALTGANLNNKTQGAIQKWIDTHLYSTGGTKDANGNTTSARVQRSDVPYTDVIDQLSAFSPAAAVKTAISYSKPSIMAAGPDDFFASLTAYVGKRQALKYAAQVFGKKVGNQLRLYGTATPATAVNSAQSALKPFGG